MRAPVRSMASLCSLLVCATISMGNKGCEEQQDSTRVLRMDVELTSLRARPVRLPNGEVLDFQTVANTLFYGQVMNNKHFVISATIPSSSGSMAGATASNARVRKSEPTSNDERLLVRFGFQVNNDGRQESTGDPLSGGRAAPIESSSRERIDFGGVNSGSVGTGSSEGTNGRVSTATNPTSFSSSLATAPLACLYNSPQTILGGDLISFEASSGGAVRIGYGQDGQSLSSNVGGKVRLERTKLDLRLRTDDPLSGQGLAVGDGVAYSSKVDLTVNFATGIPLGLDFFYKTALSDVIKKAMSRALEEIVDRHKRQMSARDSWDDVWESRVVYDPVLGDNDTHVAIRGGYRSSLRVGDRFRIHNTRYVWTGAECASTLRYKIPLSNGVGALVEVVSLGDNVAVARVLENAEEQAILPGATVKIESLLGTEPNDRDLRGGKKQTLASR